MNLFEAVKESVSARSAAEHYGIKVGRNGMACCPFHPDRYPSMKLDKRFHCFGCQADGDVIDFAAKLFGLPKWESAQKLAQDFDVPYDRHYYRQSKPSAEPSHAIPPPVIRYQQAEAHCYRALCDYLHHLEQWKSDYAPQSPDEEFHPLFCEALQKMSYLKYLLDDIFLNGEQKDRIQYIREHGKEVLALEERMQKPDAGDRKTHDRGRRRDDERC